MAIAKLSIDIEARLAGIEKDLGKVAKLGEDAASRLGAAFETAGSVVVASFGALGGAGISVAVKRVIDDLDRLDESAERVGVSVENLSALNYAGRMNGVQFDEMTAALSKLSVKMQEAASGNKDAVALFRDIGVSVVDASGKLKTADQAFVEVADKFSRFENGAAKTALAVDAFGRSGATLVPLLNQGADGIADLRKEAEQLGGLIGNDVARQAAEFNDNLDKINVSIKSLGVSLAGGILDDLNKLSEALVASTKAAGGFFSGLFLLGGDDASNPMGALVDAESKLSALRKARDDIANSAANKSFLRGVPLLGTESDLKDLDLQIAHFETRRTALLEVMRRDFKTPTLDGVESQIKRTPSSAGKEKVDNTYDKLIASIREKVAAQQLESDVQRSLTEGEKLAAKVMVEIRDGTIKLTDTQKSSVAASLDQLIVLDKLNVARKGEAEAVQHLAEMTKRFGRANDSKLDTLAIMPEAVARLNAELRKVDDTAADVRDRLAKMLGDGKLTPDAYAVKIGELNKIVDEQKSKVVELSAVQDRMNGSWETGAVRALQSYSDSARNVAAQTEQAFSRAFSGMEDALVGFVKTGKLDFSSLADSIISDLIRIQIRQSMTSMLSSGGGFISLIGSMFGGSASSSVGTGASLGFSNLLASARGNVFSSPGLSAWSGRIVSTPTVFPFARGAGLMGEAGPEAILPLKRGPGGYLGVRAEASSARPNVTVNVINQSSQSVTAGQPKISTDAMGQMIVDVMLSDLRRNGPYAQQLKRAG